MNCNTRRYIKFLILVCLFFSYPLIIDAQNFSKSDSDYQYSIKKTSPDSTFAEYPPALSAGEVTGQVIGGAFVGGVGGFIGGMAAVDVFNCSGKWCGIGEFIGGAVVGYTVTSSLVIYGIGNTSQRKASYPAVLLGDVTGMALGIFLVDKFGNGATKFQRIALGVAFFSLPLAGAIISYNLSRRYKKSYLNKKKFSFKALAPSVVSVSPLIEKNYAPGLSVINIQF